ncbi:MAG: IclR family transcriptional regulator [Thalassotalea sp.]
MTTAPTKRKYSAPALDKGFDILELLAETKVPMSLVQIASELSRSKSELYRMLAALEERGYLARNEGSDDYYITNKLFDLGMKVPPVGTLVEAAFPMLHALSDNILQACHIAVPNQERIVVIASVESPAIVNLAVRVGHHIPIHESSSGHVLLSWMRDKQQKIVLDSLVDKKYSEFDRDVLLAKVNKVRARGYEEMKSTIVPGLTDISYPIFMKNTGYAIAALTVPYMKNQDTDMSIAQVRKHIAASAEKISAITATYSGF